MERSEAVIDLRALRANFEVARERAGGAAMIAVVKADAYGHGAVPVSRALVAAGCERLAVVTVEEGVVLRESGLAVPILVLGGVGSEAEAREARARGLTPILHDAQPLPWLAAEAGSEPLAVQVEVDTGMHRMGVPPDAASELLDAVRGTPGLRLEGLYTHLARADEAELGPSTEQLERFRRLLDAQGADAPDMIHFANSAGLLAGPVLSSQVPSANAVRPGLMLYGASPAPHFDVELSPVMTLRTRVAHVRDVPKGAGVGYGAIFRAARDTRVATLPHGYADGIPRSTSNRGSVRIRGRSFPIVGRVSMDFIAVEVGPEDGPTGPIELGDEAVIFGGSGDMGLPVEEAAAAADTLAYELLVRVGARVPRVYRE